MTFLPATAFEVTPLIAFGLLLLVGALGGYLAHRYSWLPSITGFMLTGLAIGPSGLGLLSQSAMDNARILISIALALILYRLGLSLDLRTLRRHPRILFGSLVENVLTFVAVFYALHLFQVPAVVAAVIAAIALSSSPAVLLHVGHEVGAQGPVTDISKTLVALNNCLSFLAFSAVLPALHQSVGNAWTDIILQPLFRLFGSVLLGVVAGWGLHQLATRLSAAIQYRFALIIGMLMLAIGLAEYLQLSLLLVPLVMGITISTVEQADRVSSLEFGSTFELFFIVLFVYAGANLHLHELLEFGVLAFVLVVVRSISKVLSSTLAAPLYELRLRSGLASGLLLIPMAGMAIGLTQTTAHLFPEYASTVSAIVLGSIVLFETLGPPVAKLAFNYCGESEHRRNATSVEES